jgi:hypothetical protein
MIIIVVLAGCYNVVYPAPPDLPFQLIGAAVEKNLTLTINDAAGNSLAATLKIKRVSLV